MNEYFATAKIKILSVYVYLVSLKFHSNVLSYAFSTNAYMLVLFIAELLKNVLYRKNSKKFAVLYLKYENNKICEVFLSETSQCYAKISPGLKLGKLESLNS